MLKKEHLTIEGLYKIVSLKTSMNLGISPKLKSAFPDIITVERPIVKYQKISYPLWLSGFTNAEGCFFISIFKSKTSTGYAVNLSFTLTQHSRDEQLLKLLIEYLDCGYVIKQRTCVNFRVTKFNDIMEKIIPFFKQYQIHGVKAKDFEDFCLVAELIKEKKHLTNTGLNKIRQIRAGMKIRRK